jgi:hypothetical protein
MQQLTELHLSSTAEKDDGSSNVYTIEGFTTVLNSLEKIPKLTTLIMQLPHVKELKISSLEPAGKEGKGIGHRGTQFIIQNLTGLTVLSIRKLCRDSENNNIGDKSAIAIGEGLKALKKLCISKICSNSENNNVGEKGAIAIANNLKGLKELYISK